MEPAFLRLLLPAGASAAGAARYIRSAPDFFCDFPDQRQLCPLFFLGEFITDFTGREAALGAEIQALQRHILRFDIVGSFLRPEQLKRARADYAESGPGKEKAGADVQLPDSSI